MAGKDDTVALLAAHGPPKGAPKGDAAPDDDMEATAAQDILDAVKGGDAGALQGALKRFVSSCMASYDKDDADAG